MGGEACGTLTERMRRARVALLAAATVAAMAALMLPGTEAEERVLKKRVEPEYPKLARRMGICGKVTLALTVDCVGRVVHATTVSGDEMLAAAAKDVVRQWRFTPGAGKALVHADFDFPVAA